MKEKKLTDEEIIKALEICANWNSMSNCKDCPIGLDACCENQNGFATYALDLIRRLQYGYSSASKASEEWKAKYEKERKENEEYNQKLDDGELLSKDYHDEQVFHYVDENAELREEIKTLKAELKKELAEHEEFTKKAKAEIERLTEEKWQAQDDLDNYHAMYQEEVKAKAELQNQVDELKAEKEDLYFQNQNLQTYIDNHENIWKRNTEQAVKDTAKEILTEIDDLTLCIIDGSNEFEKGYFQAIMDMKTAIKDLIKEHYGVEVK